MKLHCYNCSVGAAIEIDLDFDFQSKYMDKYLDSTFAKVAGSEIAITTMGRVK